MDLKPIPKRPDNKKTTKNEMKFFEGRRGGEGRRKKENEKSPETPSSPLKSDG